MTCRLQHTLNSPFLRCRCSAEDTFIPARGKGIVKTDLSIACPHGTYARVAPRSGLAVKNFIDTGAGVVDEDYRGNVGVVLFNHSDVDFQGGDGTRAISPCGAAGRDVVCVAMAPPLGLRVYLVLITCLIDIAAKRSANRLPLTVAPDAAAVQSRRATVLLS